MGLPRLQDGTLSIITLIVRATTDELGALTGRLGSLPGVSVKSALAKIPAATGHGSASGEGQQDGDL
jgi:aspartate ammonia-lyase